MKQKVVIKVSRNDQASGFCCFSPKSSRSKALKLAAGFKGVQSVARRDQDLIEVIGEIDVLDLGNLLRKKVGSVEVLSSGEAKKEDEGREDKPREKKDAKNPPVPSSGNRRRS